MLIDSHCHLDHIDLGPFGGSFAAAIAAAKAMDVTRMICVSVDWETLPQVLQLAEQFPEVSASVGVHPTADDGVDPTVEMLVAKAQHPKVVAIGETGLDYYRAPTPAEVSVQQMRFRHHIRAAKLTQKPLIIHTRSARADTLRLLKEEANEAGVFHCFTEDWETAKAGLDLGLYISFSGIVTFKNAQALQEVAKKVPLDRLLVETDAPYLTPAPYRGQPNHPGYTRLVAECIASLRGIPYPEVCAATTENALRLFKLHTF